MRIHSKIAQRQPTSSLVRSERNLRDAHRDLGYRWRFSVASWPRMWCGRRHLHEYCDLYRRAIVVWRQRRLVVCRRGLRRHRVRGRFLRRPCALPPRKHPDKRVRAHGRAGMTSGGIGRVVCVSADDASCDGLCYSCGYNKPAVHERPATSNRNHGHGRTSRLSQTSSASSGCGDDAKCTSHNFGFSPKSRGCRMLSASGGRMPAATCSSICRRKRRRTKNERRTMPHETKRSTKSVARNVRLHELSAHIAETDDMSGGGGCSCASHKE